MALNNLLGWCPGQFYCNILPDQARIPAGAHLPVYHVVKQGQGAKCKHLRNFKAFKAFGMPTVLAKSFLTRDTVLLSRSQEQRFSDSSQESGLFVADPLCCPEQATFQLLCGLVFPAAKWGSCRCSSPVRAKQNHNQILIPKTSKVKGCSIGQSLSIWKKDFILFSFVCIFWGSDFQFQYPS